jgi:hypothetical protein
MSLSREEVNPLGILNFRKLSFIPNHFTKINVDPDNDANLLEHWIVYNLNSRYAIVKSYIVDHSNKMIETLEVGIEDSKELTMLTLGCPYIHRNKKEIF